MKFPNYYELKLQKDYEESIKGKEETITEHEEIAKLEIEQNNL